MDNISEYQKVLKIASAILTKKGQVSLQDISALPFIDKDFDIQVISNALKQMFDVEIINKKSSSTPYMQWENIVRLNTPPLSLQLTKN